MLQTEADYVCKGRGIQTDAKPERVGVKEKRRERETERERGRVGELHSERER